MYITSSHNTNTPYRRGSLGNVENSGSYRKTFQAVVLTVFFNVSKAWLLSIYITRGVTYYACSRGKLNDRQEVAACS